MCKYKVLIGLFHLYLITKKTLVIKQLLFHQVPSMWQWNKGLSCFHETYPMFTWKYHIYQKAILKIFISQILIG